jgi:hypothetical protein
VIKATAQVTSFLEQWKSFAENSCSGLQQSLNAQLESLCSSADTLAEDLGRDNDSFLHKDHVAEQELQNIEQEAVALRAEVNSAAGQYRTEETKLKNELSAMKIKVLDTAKKAISMHRDVSKQSNKNQNKELLKALKNM